MENFVCCTFVVATMSAFIVTLLHKWGAVEYMQVHAPRLLSELAKCNFCMSWWVSVGIAALPVIFGRIELIDGIAVAMCATPIARYLI